MRQLGTFVVGVVVGVVVLWAASCGQRQRAQDDVAAADALAEQALDTAQAIRQRLATALAADSLAELVREDSVAVWRARALEADAQLQRARVASQVAEVDLRATLDATQAVQLDVLLDGHQVEVAALTQQRDDARAEAAQANVEVGEVRLMLHQAMDESAALRGAVVELQAGQAARDAIIASQNRQSTILKAVGTVVVVVAGARELGVL